MIEKTDDIETLIAKIEERENRAKRVITVWTALPVLFVSIFLIVAWYQRQRMTMEVADLKQQEQTLNANVASAKKEYDDLRANIEKLYSVRVTMQNEVYEIKATAKATGKGSENLPEYRFAIYIN
jgi:cell division protein FtsB